MKVLVIGGSGFIGSPTVHALQHLGQTVTVFHRGKSPSALSGVEHILGDRKQFHQHRETFRRLAPEVVIDMILSSGTQAETLMQVFRGVARRVVAISSMDVYRAFGIFHGTEPGPLQPVPLTEESEVRRNLHPYPQFSAGWTTLTTRFQSNVQCLQMVSCQEPFCGCLWCTVPAILCTDSSRF